jgi:phage terminase large subunit-like protein
MNTFRRLAAALLFAVPTGISVAALAHTGGSRIPIPPRGKEIRAEPFAAAWQGGNVYAVAGAWIADFLEEAEPWPAGKTKDQIGCGLESCPF